MTTLSEELVAEAEEIEALLAETPPDALFVALGSRKLLKVTRLLRTAADVLSVAADRNDVCPHPPVDSVVGRGDNSAGG